MPSSFHLAVVTDEIDPDLERALQVAGELGLRWVELNNVWGRSVIDLSPAETLLARELLADGGFQVAAVDPPAFKACVVDTLTRGSVADDPVFRRHLEMVKRGAEQAHRFGARLIRVFSFRRAGITGLGNPSPRLPAGGPLPDDVLDRVAEGLHAAAGVAEAEDVVLGLENVRSCWGNSGENLAAILRRVASPRLRAIWDPANAFVAGGRPYPQGYDSVRPYLAHVHVKDAAVLDPETGLTTWEAVGAGEVEWPAHLRALARDGYRGLLCLETHWRAEGLTSEEATRQSLAGLRRLLEEA